MISYWNQECISAFLAMLLFNLIYYVYCYKSLIQLVYNIIYILKMDALCFEYCSKEGNESYIFSTIKAIPKGRNFYRMK